MRCEGIEHLLAAWALGDLAGSPLARVQEHLAACPACREKAVQMKQAVALVGQELGVLGRPVLSPERRAAVLAQAGPMKQALGGRPGRRWSVATPQYFLAAAACLLLGVVLIGLFLPSLGAARRTANQMKSLTQLRGIQQGMTLAAQNNEDKYPTDIGELVTKNYVTPQYLVSPWSDTQVPPDIGSWSPQRQAQWARENSSYVFIRPGQKADTSGQEITAYEKPTLGKPTIGVVHADGRAEQLPVAEAMKLVAGQTPSQAVRPEFARATAALPAAGPESAARMAQAKTGVSQNWFKDGGALGWGAAEAAEKAKGDALGRDRGRRDDQWSISPARPENQKTEQAPQRFNQDAINLPGMIGQGGGGGGSGKDDVQLRTSVRGSDAVAPPRAGNARASDLQTALSSGAPGGKQAGQQAAAEAIKEPKAPAAEMEPRGDRTGLSLGGAARLHRAGDTNSAGRRAASPLAMKDKLADAEGDRNGARVERERALDVAKELEVLKSNLQASASGAPAATATPPAEIITQDFAGHDLPRPPATPTLPPPSATPPTPAEPSAPEEETAAQFAVVPVNPWVLTAQTRLSTFALNVDIASYALCRNFLRRGQLPPIGAVRMEEFINAFDYNYPQHSAGPGEDVFHVYAEAAPSPFAPRQDNLTLVKIGVQARIIGREGRKPAHLVFVIDTSGSMARPDRLPLVQDALERLTAKLGPADRISIVTFAARPSLIAAAVPATHTQALLQMIEGLRCRGSTNLMEGLKLGYEVARRHFVPGIINRVILCSDGVANIGATEAQVMLHGVAAAQEAGVTFTAVGVGMGAYNDALLQQLADKGDGNYYFVDTPTEAQRVLVDQMAATLQLVAKDARIQVDFDPAVVRRYRLIGYESRAIANERFRDDTVQAGGVGSGQQSTALYEVELKPDAWASDGGPGTGGQVTRGPVMVGRDLGTVYVRYRNIETGQIEEIQRRLEGSIVQNRTPESDPRFFLAASAAQLAEILRQSPHAQGRNLKPVVSVLQRVCQELPLDTQAAELLRLVQRAEGMGK